MHTPTTPIYIPTKRITSLRDIYRNDYNNDCKTTRKDYSNTISPEQPFIFLERDSDKFVEDSSTVSDIAKNYIRKNQYHLSLGIYIFLLGVIKEKILVKLKHKHSIDILSDLFISVLSQAKIASDMCIKLIKSKEMDPKKPVDILILLFNAVDALVQYGNSMHKNGSSPYIKNSLTNQLGITSNDHKNAFSKALSIMIIIRMDTRFDCNRKRVSLNKEISYINNLLI